MISDGALAILFTTVGGIILALVNGVMQRNSKKAEEEAESGKFAWGMTQTLMTQYQSDLGTLRTEFIAVKTELTVVKAQLAESKKLAVSLQESVNTLVEQNEVLAKTVKSLQEKLDVAKGTES